MGLDILCPSCHGTSMMLEGERIRCEFCDTSFPQSDFAYELGAFGSAWYLEAVRFLHDYGVTEHDDYRGTIEYLESEGFTHRQAQYAVDHAGIDWNAICAAWAKEELDACDWSRGELLDTLENGGFTHEQAVHAVDCSGIDWPARAVAALREMLESYPMPRQECIEELLSEGWGVELVRNAIDQADIDWNTVALRYVQRYYIKDSWTKKELREDLVAEGFTPAQAAFAARNW